LEPKKDDPVQSVTSTAVSSADDTESNRSSGQITEVRDVEDIAAHRFPGSGKSVASATIVSKSTISSSPGARSAVSCTIMPAPQVHPSEDIGMVVKDSCEAPVLQNDETVAIPSAHKTTNVKAHMMPAETPKTAPGSACKNLFENVASVVKLVANSEEFVSFARQDMENATEQKVADESVDMHLDRSVTPSSSSHKNPAEMLVTTDANASSLVQGSDTESTESSREQTSPDSPTMTLEIEADFGEDFVLGSEQDSPNSAAVAEELGAESCIGSTRKSISFGPFDDSVPSTKPIGRSEGSSCSDINSDSPSRDGGPLKTQPDFASEGEIMSDDEEEKVEDFGTTASPPVVISCTQRSSIPDARSSPRISPTKSVLELATEKITRRSPRISPMKSVLELATEKITLSKSTTHATPKKSQVATSGDNFRQDWISQVRQLIQPNDEWRTVMGILREQGGLTFEKGNNLVAFYWIFPGGKSQREGGVLGVDYVDDEDALKAVAVNQLGWNGGFEYAKRKSRESRRRLSRGFPATGGSPQARFVEPSVPKSTRKALVSPAEQLTKKARIDVVTTVITDEIALPDRKEKLREKLLCCQQVLQVQFEVSKLSSCSSPKFQNQLERVDAFLNAVVDSKGANCAEAFSGGAMLYLSGAPGVGKTSAVNHACKRLEVAHKNVVFCNISGSQAKSRLNIMGKLANSLNLNSNAPDEKIEDTLKAGRGRRNESRLVIMIIDEIDDILSGAPSSKGNKKAKNEGEETLATLFEWAKKTSVSFALIGISNVVGGPKTKHIRDLGLVSTCEADSCLLENVY
jgi:ATPase family associated with various cellular activities (AAA)